MIKIDYNKQTEYIFTLIDWRICCYNTNLSLNKIIVLNYEFPSFIKVSYFKFDELQNHFQIVFTDYKQVYSFEFDINGNLISKKILSENREKTILQLDNYNIINVVFTDEHYSYEAKCNLLYKNGKFLEISLHDEFDKQEKEWCGYEYIESLVNTNQQNEFSLINVDATYGVQGVKIYRINSLGKLDLMYDMDDLDYEGAFHELTFNSTGNNFTVLLYERSINFTDYFSILEYSIDNNKKPKKIYKTEYGYDTFGNIYTHYLNDSILGIIRNTDIIIFDLENGTTREIFKRDADSAYYVGNNVLIFQSNEELVFKKF